MKCLKDVEIAKYNKGMERPYLFLQSTFSCGDINSILKYRSTITKGDCHADRI